jgi:formamidopyrimidine-DNA glycosylase
VPELPEVETVRRGLRPRVAGRVLARVEIRDGRLTAPLPPQELEAELAGERVLDVGRRGKYLVLALEGGRSLVVHLRMTGGFSLAAAGDPDPAYLRARFWLDDGTRLDYTDIRRFGTMRLVEPAGAEAFWRRRVGPEPLSPEWTPRLLRTALAGRRAPVKALLLAQDVVAGIGNIYADEALWEARLHPLRAGGDLRPAEVRRLHAAVVAALQRGIDAQGASIRDYRDADGRRGSMQERFAVYGREGEPCPRCGTSIAKIRVAGRGTHFCPRDQRVAPRARRAAPPA